jgi:DNA-binding CsgD family transcriptional regulator
VATPALRELGAVQLSPREREVAQLAASGYTSREVAVRLSISVRTVDNLLQRAYTKLGVRQRDELVAALEHA